MDDTLVAPTCSCGLPMTKNPHPDAGKPTQESTEIGYEYECIPCLVKTRNRVGRDMRTAQAQLKALREAAKRYLADPSERNLLMLRGTIQSNPIVRAFGGEDGE